MITYTEAYGINKLTNITGTAVGAPVVRMPVRRFKQKARVFHIKTSLAVPEFNRESTPFGAGRNAVRPGNQSDEPVLAPPGNYLPLHARFGFNRIIASSRT